VARERAAALAGWTPSGRRPHGSDPKSSVVNRYGQSWDIPNLFITGGSTHLSIGGFNPTLTMQALTSMTADAIVNRYQKRPGPLV
jgi:gluconate 2-dehydrogenase alpha chain